jgi:hypothetical protein
MTLQYKLIFILFIYGLFSDADKNSDYTASNNKMINEKLAEKM